MCFGLLKVGLNDCHFHEKCIWFERTCRVFGLLARKWIREALAPGFWESGVLEPLLQSCCFGLWWMRQQQKKSHHRWKTLLNHRIYSSLDSQALSRRDSSLVISLYLWPLYSTCLILNCNGRMFYDSWAQGTLTLPFPNCLFDFKTIQVVCRTNYC